MCYSTAYKKTRLSFSVNSSSVQRKSFCHLLVLLNLVRHKYLRVALIRTPIPKSRIRHFKANAPFGKSQSVWIVQTFGQLQKVTQKVTESKFGIYTSQKTQPLDRTVFRPLKTFFNAAANSRMLRLPGTPITIYQMAALIGNVWMNAATPVNITAGFRASHVWHLAPESMSVWGGRLPALSGDQHGAAWWCIGPPYRW